MEEYKGYEFMEQRRNIMGRSSWKNGGIQWVGVHGTMEEYKG